MGCSTGIPETENKCSNYQPILLSSSSHPHMAPYLFNNNPYNIPHNTHTNVNINNNTYNIPHNTQTNAPTKVNLNNNLINNMINNITKSSDELIDKLGMGLCRVNHYGRAQIKTSGFLCKIPFPDKNKLLPVIIISNLAVNESLIKAIGLVSEEELPKLSIKAKYNFSMTLSLSFDKKIKRKKHIEQGVAIFELIEKDGIDNYLNYLLNIYDFNNFNYGEFIKNIDPYVFSNDLNSADSIYYTPCKITEINESKKTFEFECEKKISDFSPIIDIKTFTLIGVYDRLRSDDKKKKGILFKDFIKNFYEEDLMLNEPDNRLIMDYIFLENTIKTRIFGDEFVKNNENKCKCIIEVMNFMQIVKQSGERRYVLYKLYDKIEDLSTHDMIFWKYPIDMKFRVSLVGIKNITNMSRIFHECSTLFELININELNTSQITDLSYMFSGCTFLRKIGDISNFNTEKVTNIEGFFSGCVNLVNCPDISKWNTSNVESIAGVFNCCAKLTSLPDISKWNTSNVEDMKCLFSNCQSLKSLPDISNWDTKNVLYLNSIFNQCINLVSLPDISKWDIGNVIKMEKIVFECINLQSLPDISKWNTKNVISMSGAFYKLQINIFPDISKWNTEKLENIKSLFELNTKLLTAPDISKWNTSNLKDASYLFSNCTSLQTMADLSKWDTKNLKDISYIFFACFSLKSLPDIYQNGTRKTL